MIGVDAASENTDTNISHIFQEFTSILKKILTDNFINSLQTCYVETFILLYTSANQIFRDTFF